MNGWRSEHAAGAVVLANAQLVLVDEILIGSVRIADGHITSIDRGRTQTPTAIDLQGDYLIPGLVDLHTDNLEKHHQPRKGVLWDPVTAAISHDAQVTAAGITTVFDSLTLGAAAGWDARAEMIEPMISGLTEAHQQGLLRADHLLHLRCEVTHSDIEAIVEAHVDHPLVRFLSLMDHAPGDRRSLAVLGRTRKKPLASHDDATAMHVEEAAELGCVITEFPTTVEAAIAAHALGMKALMGAPNLILGGSHSGNVTAADLARAGKLDLFASDYIPSSMLAAAFKLTEPPFSWPLPRAIQTITKTPASAGGLMDRGEIAEGLAADLARVCMVGGRPIVQGIWRQGVRQL